MISMVFDFFTLVNSINVSNACQEVKVRPKREQLNSFAQSSAVIAFAINRFVH